MDGEERKYGYGLWAKTAGTEFQKLQNEKSPCRILWANMSDPFCKRIRLQTGGLRAGHGVSLARNLRLGLRRGPGPGVQFRERVGRLNASLRFLCSGCFRPMACGPGVLFFALVRQVGDDFSGGGNEPYEPFLKETTSGMVFL